ncbi:hypothetical protein I2484_18445, partial [Sporosarcina sp. E16_8]|nr:hypothetical protein [Sporosarcina sp. E16_8]
MRKNRGNKKKKLLGRFNRVMYLLLSVQMILISVLPMLPPVSAAEVEGEKVEAKKNDNGNSKSFVTTESTSSTQTQTFTIPGLKKLNGSTVNTGNVEVLSVVGEEVTVRLKDGVRSRQEQTGGTYTPESTQTESDTRTNTTGSFPVNITKNNITLSKDGSATSVQTGGSYDPGGTKSNWHGNGYGLLGYTHFEVGECGNYTGCINWQFRGNTPNNTVYFIDPDGYSGNLVIQKWYWSNYSSFFEELYKIPEVSLGQKTSFPNYGNYFAPYGTLTKPAKDTRTYNYTQKYKGTKIIPATDTRTYQDYYQYEVMFDYEGDTTPPTIGLTANPTALTNQDVTISADIKDVENTTLKTDEGTNSTHTQTFKIPHMKKMDKVTVDTGTVEVVSVDGGQVTVKMKDGVPIRREVTGGSYTPPDTRFVTNQSASYYNSGGYTGNLTAYQTSEVQEYVSHILSGYNVHVSSGWSGVITNFEFPETYRYNTGGVVGYIPISKIVSGNWYTFETNIYRQDVTVTYAGMATRLSATRYQGNVTKPATDTRTYTDTYQYAITFDYEKDVPVQKWAMGNHPVSYFSDSGNVFTGKSFKVMDSGTYTVFARDLVGNESVKLIAISNIDKVAPVITLTPNISLPTNKNIIVTANIADDSSISEKKWAVGSHDATYFASSGTTLGASFEVSENGTFTVYAKDAAGNISVQVIKITNIDRLAPVISLTASPTTLTATDVTITADIRDLDNELFKTPESTSIT